MAKDAKKGKADAKAKGAKDAKKDKKGKKGKKGAADAESVLSVAGHPIAKRHVRRAKGAGGLIGFAFAAILSFKASVPLTEIGERALIAGVAGYLIGWAASVTIWRQLMIAELKVKVEQISRRRAAEAEE
jgi:hypothetical protein